MQIGSVPSDYATTPRATQTTPPPPAPPQSSASQSVSPHHDKNGDNDHGNSASGAGKQINVVT